eukprot:g27507.t1
MEMHRERREALRSEADEAERRSEELVKQAEDWRHSVGMGWARSAEMSETGGVAPADSSVRGATPGVLAADLGHVRPGPPAMPGEGGLLVSALSGRFEGFLRRHCLHCLRQHRSAQDELNQDELTKGQRKLLQFQKKAQERLRRQAAAVDSCRSSRSLAATPPTSAGAPRRDGYLGRGIGTMAHSDLSAGHAAERRRHTTAHAATLLVANHQEWSAADVRPPASAASTEWIEGEAARPPSRPLLRSQSVGRVYPTEGGLCGSLLGGPREPPLLYALRQRDGHELRELRECYEWAQPKMAPKAFLKTKKLARSPRTPQAPRLVDSARRDKRPMDPNGYGYRPVPTEMDGATPSPGAAPGSKEAFQNKQWVAEKALRRLTTRGSAGWTISYTGLAMRGLLFMVFNNLLQGFLLYMISKEERIINKFGSQMFLCDFAAHMERCPEGPNCVGPGGTSFTPSRLYPFELWTTRTFVRDSLVSLFPERKADILKDVDPGEYGVESYWLRLVCCFLFVLGLWHDLAGSWDMLDLLWYVPTQSELWIVPLAPKEEEEAAQPMPTMLLSDIAAHEAIEMDFVQFRVAGMPLHWKLFNLMCLLFPTPEPEAFFSGFGVRWAMGMIEDMIINCVALGFILQIDPRAGGVGLEGSVSRRVLCRANCVTEEDEEIIQHQQARSWHIWTPNLWLALVPRRLVAMVAVASFFVAKYYVEHCVMESDWSLVSKPLRLPRESNLPWISFLFGPIPILFPIDAEDEPVWQMPDSSSP